MNYLPQALCVVGFVGVLFAGWGMKTEAGKRMFDEMAGIIPIGVGVVGVFLVLIGGVWLVVRSRS